jgi:hypothetical protein
MLPLFFDILDQVGCGVFPDLAIGLALTRSALVVQNDVELLGIEIPEIMRRTPPARPAVQIHDRFALWIAAHLVKDFMKR